MFAPDGYVSFIDVSESVQHLAYSALTRITGVSSESQHYRAKFAERMVQAELVADNRNARFVSQVVEEFFLAKLLEAYPPGICSPTGTVMRVTTKFFLHGDRLDWFYLRFPIDQMPELSGYITFNRQGAFDGQAIRKRYCFIDAETGIVKLKNNSLSLYDSCSHQSEDDSAELIKVVKQFCGWSLCWKEDDLPTSIELVRRVFPETDDKFKWADFFEEGAELSTTSSERILAEVLQAYPDGKTDYWSVVEKRVGYARRSIERALADTGRKDWKMQGGQR